MSKCIVPLVGAHFRPPAKALIQALPSSHRLELRPEPSNPYDPNAIAVWLDAATIPDDILQDELRFTLPGMGQDVDGLLSERWWQLGYIAKDQAAIYQEPVTLAIAANNEEAPDDPWTGFPCALAFDGSGKPAVLFNI